MNVCEKLDSFYNDFKGEKGIIGYSFLQTPIYYCCVKKSIYPKIIVHYSIHAREYITTYLALKHINDFENYGKVGSVYFIPMLNPDGVNIALTDNPLYKANARGVDLNVNFDANWGTGKYNVRKSGSENYIGTHPFSEPETQAIRDFTLKVKPNATISYHSKGEEIYWEFFQPLRAMERDFKLAKSIAKATGYELKSTPNSAGGYKDWCILKLGIPALTIEVGSDELVHPIGEQNLEQIYSKNKDVIFACTENEIWK